MQAVRILRQTAVSNFSKAKEALHDSKDALDSRACSRLEELRVPLRFCQRPITIRTFLREVERLWRFYSDDITLSDVSRIAPYARFGSVQESVEHLAVVNVRARRLKRMRYLRRAIDTNVSFHAEEPLVALRV